MYAARRLDSTTLRYAKDNNCTTLQFDFIKDS